LVSSLVSKPIVDYSLVIQLKQIHKEILRQTPRVIHRDNKAVFLDRRSQQHSHLYLTHKNKQHRQAAFLLAYYHNLLVGFSQLNQRNRISGYTANLLHSRFSSNLKLDVSDSNRAEALDFSSRQ
jgi:hypothetical protein